MAALAEASGAWPEMLHRQLVWFEAYGFGFYPVDLTAVPYDDAYFQKYVRYSKTVMGQALTNARKELVSRYWDGDLVDVGIGCGSFVDARARTWGYDINPTGVEWLHRHDKWWNPYVDPCSAVSLWDVLEHIPDFHRLLANVSRFVFASVPVFNSAAGVLRSKHYRPDEHVWYFTVDGLKKLMAELGWNCLTVEWTETLLGRESIASFVFERA
jgi:Methyltransferase domain